MGSVMQPPEKTTTALPVVPDWAIELTKSMKSGFTSVNARLDGIETNQELQRGHVVDLSTRLTGLDARMAKVEDRATANSIRARTSSDVDLKHESDLAKLVVAVAAIEEKTDAQTKILARAEQAASKLAANPIVRSIAVMLGTAILTWLAAHGGVR